VIVLFGLRVRGEFGLAAAPAVQVGVAEGAGGVPRRPSGAAGDVEDAAAFGVLSSSVDEGLGGGGVDQRLGGGLEAGADQGSGGAEGEGRRHAAAVREPAGRQYRCRRHQIHHDGNERQRRPPAPSPVTAGFGALRHDDVGAHIDRLPGLLKIGDLNDQDCFRRSDELSERANPGPAPARDRRRQRTARRAAHRRQRNRVWRTPSSSVKRVDIPIATSSRSRQCGSQAADSVAQ
jgi:hypothetical protein